MRDFVVIVDTNILVSALITPGKVRKLFFHEVLVPVAPKKALKRAL